MILNQTSSDSDEPDLIVPDGIAHVYKQSLGDLRQRNRSKFSSKSTTTQFNSFTLLYDNNHEKTLRKYESCFRELLNSMNKIKVIVVAFSVCHSSFILSSDFFPLQLFDEPYPKSSWCLTNSHHLIQLVSYIFMCIGVVIGLLVAFRFPPNRHLFSFDRHNSFFRSLCVFIALIVADIITITLNEYDLQIAIIIPITVKSVLTGFLFIYLLYTLFDLKVDAITRDEARNNVRIYIFMLTLGIVITLSLYLLYFSDLSHFDRQYLHTFVFGVLMSRIFLSINCAILLFIVWYGAASIDKLNVVSNIDFDDFLYQYDVDLCTTVVTLDCICCACQSKLSRDFNHFDEDNYSIRTVNEWRKTCFIISGTSLLSFTLASEMCQFFFPTLWPMHYYSHSLSESQILYAQISLFVSLLVGRSIMLFIKDNNRFTKLLEKHYLKHVLIYSFNILGNLFQLFLMKWNFYLVLLTNLLIGLTLGLKLEMVLRLIASFITITPMMMRHALMCAIMFSTLLSFGNYVLLHYFQYPKSVYWFNFVTTWISLLIVFIVSRSCCLVSKSSFDLIELNNIAESSVNQVDSSEINEVGHIKSPSTSSTRTFTRCHAHSSPSPVLEHSDSSDNESNDSRLSSYYFTCDGVMPHKNTDIKRKSSIHTIMGYTIKYRLESIVSILHNK